MIISLQVMPVGLGSGDGLHAESHNSPAPASGLAGEGAYDRAASHAAVLAQGWHDGIQTKSDTVATWRMGYASTTGPA